MEGLALETLCIIPARGGSKGFPRKNLALLDGKPLIAWSVRAALGAEMVSRVVVSTEDAEIAAAAREAGGEVVDRPVELAADDTPNEPVFLHVLETLREQEGYNPDLFVNIQCTSPLATAEDIDGTIKTFLNSDADLALAAVPCHPFIWRIGEDGYAEAVNHDSDFRRRRQDMECSYQELGTIYVSRTETFLKHRRRFYGRKVIYPLPPERGIDIDEPKDLTIAMALLGLDPPDPN